MITGLSHVSIVVPDLEAAAKALAERYGLVTGERMALVVPESAVFQVQNRAYVYRLDGEVVRQQEIEVGGRSFGIVEVANGLAEGEGYTELLLRSDYQGEIAGGGRGLDDQGLERGRLLCALHPAADLGPVGAHGRGRAV